MKLFFLLLLLILSNWAFAEPDPRLVPLEAAFQRAQQEQQSVYQQFLMAQELRRNELHDPTSSAMRSNAVIGVDPLQPVNYDEHIRAERERLARLQRYDREINQAYARFLELGEQKRALLEQIRELSLGARR